MADEALRSREEVAAQAVSVRSELKSWEKDFSKANDGKKAGREDIKQRPDIAAKYKEYSRLKNLEASLIRRENRKQQEAADPSRKRKHTSPTGPSTTTIETTPRKLSRGLFATPSRNRTGNQHSSHLDLYDSPTTLRRLFSPSAHRQKMPEPSPLKPAIGPTPQRDGKALGLFDMLSESGGSRGTPSAKRQRDVLAAGFRTPSKPKLFEPIAEAPEEAEEETSRLTRTPASSTKQFYLANLFATPTTMRYAAMVEAEENNTAQGNKPQETETTASQHSNPSGTPSFLRRSNSGRYPPAAPHEGPGLSPIASRKPPQLAGRGLSHLVQGLRAMEDERLAMEEEQLEDEWEMLREIEAEQEGFHFEVPESQGPVAEKQQPYKKKGQKRTTRRVNMRPTISKSKPQEELYPDLYSESDEEPTAVPETQIPEAPQKASDDAPGEEGNNDDDVASLHSISEPESDYEGATDVDSDDDPEYGEKAKTPPRPKSFSERIKEAVLAAKPTAMEPPSKPSAKPSQKPEEPEKEKKPREYKINPQAHANYRRSMKPKGRGGGRFRRR
ncbi:hypothetical protein N7466_005784 [Penicillium verhagenii]|uniref:uncharacterized protein n=1 Tax=Penicillium verhagenii TaxID=1562060 RepID=UPI0025453311|nr:uncharacterized protein N7466_005784 [Penicillium verhagenii]KAJ5930291.1 hypothetical protein N7466_005784 [Penicillium verhagenii]